MNNINEVNLERLVDLARNAGALVQTEKPESVLRAEFVIDQVKISDASGHQMSTLSSLSTHSGVAIKRIFTQVRF